MTTGEQPNRASLYRKIAAVAGAIAAVAKDGYNPQLKYKYATPATVMEAVKPLLAEQHLAIVPTMSQVIKEPTGSKTQSGAEKVLTRVEMIYLILDGESGESLSVPWAGEGEDWSDKGIAKAQTIALRTFLIQLFQIPAEDPDTDPDARQVQTPQQPARSAPQRPQQARPANGTRMPVVSRSALEAAPEASYEPPPTTLAEIERDERTMQKIGPLPRAPEATPAKPQMKPKEAEERFFARYQSVIGGKDWNAVQIYLATNATQPKTVDGWIAVAEDVKKRDKLLIEIERLVTESFELALEVEQSKPTGSMTMTELEQYKRTLNAAIAEAEARDIQPVAA